jgi:RNA polymerase sigma factor (TIGR02999 family)
MTDIKATMDLLSATARGQSAEAQQLFVLVYDELRVLAESWLRRERVDHTLQPTALVHEAYLKMVDQRSATFNDRAHFLAAASEAIRRILVDHARRRAAAKRGGDWQRFMIDTAAIEDSRESTDLLALDEALERLSSLHPRQADVVKFKFFGGLTGDDIAGLLGVDRATVARDWTTARAWLLAQLAGDLS